MKNLNLILFSVLFFISSLSASSQIISGINGIAFGRNFGNRSNIEDNFKTGNESFSLTERNDTIVVWLVSPGSRIALTFFNYCFVGSDEIYSATISKPLYDVFRKRYAEFCQLGYNVSSNNADILRYTDSNNNYAALQFVKDYLYISLHSKLFMESSIYNNFTIANYIDEMP
jgi:hypothetical protein